MCDLCTKDPVEHAKAVDRCIQLAIDMHNLSMYYRQIAHGLQDPHDPVVGQKYQPMVSRIRKELNDCWSDDVEEEVEKEHA